MLLQGQIGPLKLSDSVTTVLRQNRTAELAVGYNHPHYSDTASNGVIYTLYQSATQTGISAGNLINAAAAAATQFALWNPVGSGVNVTLTRFSFAIISATTLPTNIFHGLFVNGVPSINTTYDAGEYAANDLAGGKAPRAKYVNTAAQSGTNLTGGSAPVAFRQAHIAFSATTYSNATGREFTEHLEGDIVLPPGTGWLPLWSGAGSSVLNAYSVTWVETPI